MQIFPECAGANAGEHGEMLIQVIQSLLVVHNPKCKEMRKKNGGPQAPQKKDYLNILEVSSRTSQPGLAKPDRHYTQRQEPIHTFLIFLEKIR